MNISTIISSFLKRLHLGAYLDPVRDWLVLVISSMIILAGIIVWNVWAFDTVASGGVIGASATGIQPTFSRSSLDSIHAVFANRSAEQAKYVTGTYRYADPSQ